MNNRSTNHSKDRATALTGGDARTSFSSRPASSAAERSLRHRHSPPSTYGVGDVIDFNEAQRQRQERRRQGAEASTSRVYGADGRETEAYEVEHSPRARLSNDRARSFRQHADTTAVLNAVAEETTQLPADEPVDLQRERRRAQHIERFEKKRARQEKRAQMLEAKRARRPACHWGLMVLATLLAIFSIPVVYSASTPVALASNKAADFFVIRQVIFVAAGYAVFLFLSQMNPRQTRIVVWSLYAVALVGLLAIDFTPFGYTQSGVRRWIKLPGLPPQQFSEFAKIAIIGVMADFWSRAAINSRNAAWPWIASAALTLPLVGLVLIQPHLSAALLLFTLPLFIAMYAGVPFRHFAKILAPLAIGAVIVVGLCKSHSMPFMKPYQQERIAAHFGSGGADAQGSNYQKLQSVKTIMSGGLLGRGPAESLGKQGHLPEPHTDFIFAVIGEEWGLVGTLLLLFAYATMIFFCFHIGHCAETAFESLLCAGVGTLLAIQVTCNMGVATGILPVTGMPLPFMSYGGSGLLCMLMGVGMVLSVSRQTSRVAQAAQKAEEDDDDYDDESGHPAGVVVNARDEFSLYDSARPSSFRPGPNRGGALA